jgi:glyoxylase-like metal-dependent hydrolase (beta-lactamase superfamily II)
MQEVAKGIYRLGAKLVNWYIVVDGGKLTLIDAGNPNQYNQLPAALAELRRLPRHVEAIVLTHGHGDHVGSSARIKDETGLAVHVHRDDVALVRGEQKREFERHWVRDLTHLQAWKTAFFFLKGGVLSFTPVLELSEFTDGDLLDVPGRPRIIHTPGHTDGASCILLGRLDAILTGDSLVTMNLGTGGTGARVMSAAVNKNSIQALESLDHLNGIEAATVLPGHGEPWVGGLASAILHARKVGPS